MAIDFVGAGSSGGAIPSAQGAGKRNNQHQTLSFADSVFEAAQAKGSLLMSATKKVSMKGNKQLFDVEKSIDYKIRRGGVLRTKFDGISTERREMESRQYDRAIAVSRVDEFTSSLDLLMSFKRQIINAQGRLLDSVILNGLITRAVKENVSIEATYKSDNDRSSLDEKLGDVINNDSLYYQSVPTLERRDNMYAKFKRTAAGAVDTSGTALEDFDVDDLTDILHIFRLRNVTEEPVATLTPEAQRVLYKDTDFKSSERVFKIGGTLDSLEGALYYRGIKWIRVQNDILPSLDIHNCAYARVNATGNRFFAVKPIDEASPVSEPGMHVVPSSIPTSVASAATTALAVRSMTVASGQLTALQNAAVYFWVPKALYCSTSGGPRIMAHGDLQAYREDPYIYSSVPVGAMLIQEDFALTYIVKGPTIAVSSAGTGTGTVVAG